jgi:ABC-type multidrug transport system ATPase subunit
VSNVVMQVAGVSKRFGRRPVLRDVSFSVRAGEVVAVTGPNGCGKTTLLRICVGLLAPDAGQVAVAGEIGYCPQHGGLIELLNPSEHFALIGAGRRVARSDAVGAGRSFARLLDWDAADGTVAGLLSGGTRQKLNVSLAQVGDPPILVLDEPYQGFDRESYVNLWSAVERWRDAGRGVLVVTHRDHHARMIDHVVELGRDLGRDGGAWS